MKYSINDRGQLVVTKTVEKVETYDIKEKRRELRSSIDSKREVITSLREEMEGETEMLKWIVENTKNDENLET